MYTQCLLTNGNKWDVVGIPTKFAKLNRTLRIDNKDGLWSVSEVYSRFEPENRRSYMNQLPSIGE